MLPNALNTVVIKPCTKAIIEVDKRNSLRSYLLVCTRLLGRIICIRVEPPKGTPKSTQAVDYLFARSVNALQQILS
jgi:hypothetical protein